MPSSFPAGRDREAMLIIHQLAAQGQPEALWILGDFHWRGHLVPQNYEKGRGLIERAAASPFMRPG